MTTQLFVRRIRDGDGATLRAIRLLALAEDSAAFATTLETADTYGDDLWAERAATASAGGERVVFVAEVNGTVEAMAGAYVREDETFATLYGMWAASELRGSGIADALVGAIETWGTKTGLERIQLCYYEHNALAVRFHTRLGYRTTEDTLARSAPISDMDAN